MAKIKVYLINLDGRPDRLQNVLNQFVNSTVDVIRVSAISGDELKKNRLQTPMPLNNVACWHSHMKVLKLFLESNDDFCVVLEDDVQFENKGIDFFEKVLNTEVYGIDILQFGYVPVNGKVGLGENDFYFRFKCKVRRILLRIAIYLIDYFVYSKWILKRIDRTRRVLNVFRINEERLKLKAPLVEGFEPGTHCYLIGRHAAGVLLKYNVPALMGADMALYFLAMARHLMIVRTSSTFAVQDNSPVSTGIHNRYEHDLGSIIFSNAEKWESPK